MAQKCYLALLAPILSAKQYLCKVIHKHKNEKNKKIIIIKMINPCSSAVLRDLHYLVDINVKID